MANEAILSLARRRRKPPRRMFWFSLAMVCWDVVFAVSDLAAVTFASISPMTMAIALLWIAMLVAWDWPRLMREWERWRRDSDA